MKGIRPIKKTCTVIIVIIIIFILMQRQVWLIPIADERVGVQVKL